MAGAEREPSDQTGSPPVDSDPRRLIGRVISGRYRIDELIGEGGMGAVYRAEHTHMRKRLAVKVLHPAMLGMTEAVERFEREAIAGAHIEHPNVAAATDFGKLEDGSHFLVLEFLEGEDLRSIVARGPVPPERALRIARQIALALRAAHLLGIVHRDLKPENIMLIQKERDADVVKVLDFGIAKVPVNSLAIGGASAKALTKLGMVYGTPEYMAPEQSIGEEIDGRADLYALGVILYEMLTGRRPFEGESRSQLVSLVMSKPPPSFAERAPGVAIPPELELVTRRLLEKSASARFLDAEYLVTALDEAAHEMGIAPASRMASSPDRSGAHRPFMITGESATVDAVVRRAQPENATVAVSSKSAANARAKATPPRGVPPPRTGTPIAAVLVALGIVAVSAIIGVAVTLRGSDAIKVLEEAEASAAATSPNAPVTSRGSPSGSNIPAPDQSSAPVPAHASAPRDELDAAKAKGPAALGALAQTYPSDPAVLKALLLALAADKSGYAAAVGLAKRMFEADPTTIPDPDVKPILFMAANAAPDVAVAALDVMASSMGTHGPDLLFELVLAPSVGKFPRDRALALLATPEVQKRSTPALLIASDLHAASPCKRKVLFQRAREEGDTRSLSFLTPILPQNGCGLILKNRDCYTCLGGRADLRAAIDAIERRAEKR